MTTTYAPLTWHAALSYRDRHTYRLQPWAQLITLGNAGVETLQRAAFAKPKRPEWEAALEKSKAEYGHYYLDRGVIVLTGGLIFRPGYDDPEFCAGSKGHAGFSLSGPGMRLSVRAEHAAEALLRGCPEIVEMVKERIRVDQAREHFLCAT